MQTTEKRKAAAVEPIVKRLADLSEPQQKALRFIYRGINHSRQAAGHGNAGLLSACNALVRKQLLGSWKTGSYFITEAGKKLIESV